MIGCTQHGGNMLSEPGARLRRGKFPASSLVQVGEPEPTSLVGNPVGLGAGAPCWPTVTSAKAKKVGFVWEGALRCSRFGFDLVQHSGGVGNSRSSVCCFALLPPEMEKRRFRLHSASRLMLERGGIPGWTGKGPAPGLGFFSFFFLFLGHFCVLSSCFSVVLRRFEGANSGGCSAAPCRTCWLCAPV